MKIYFGLLVSVILAGVIGVPRAWATDPFVAESATDMELYLAVAGGWTYAEIDKFELSSAPISGEIFFEDGWTGKVALGAHITDHVRTELELALRHNALDYETIVGVGTIELEGETNVYTGLAKVAYDFGDGPIRPFIGVGLGVASFDVEIDAPVTGSGSNLA